MSNTENLPLQEEDALQESSIEENMADTVASADQTVTETELERAKREAAEWKDKFMRLFAEFDNYKKRSFKEKMETIQTAGKEIILSMLEILDDSERAEKQMETATDMQAVKDGMQLVFNKLKSTLTHKGLQSFDSIGHDFDVEKHEAITEIPAPTPDMEGKVIDQVQKGYLLNDKLIRHAKVVVGKSSND